MSYQSLVRDRLAAAASGTSVESLLLRLENLPGLPELAPGFDVCRDQQLNEVISILNPETMFDCVHNLQAAHALKSGLLLWNDDLEASHTISQQLHDDTGSYWHGIMHRREPDHSNAKYLFHRFALRAIHMLYTRKYDMVTILDSGIDPNRHSMSGADQIAPFCYRSFLPKINKVWSIKKVSKLGRKIYLIKSYLIGLFFWKFLEQVYCEEKISLKRQSAVTTLYWMGIILTKLLR